MSRVNTVSTKHTSSGPPSGARLAGLTNRKGCSRGLALREILKRLSVPRTLFKVRWGAKSKRESFYDVVGRPQYARDNIQPGNSRQRSLITTQMPGSSRGPKPKACRCQYIHVQIKARGGRPISNGSIAREPCSQQREAL